MTRLIEIRFLNGQPRVYQARDGFSAAEHAERTTKQHVLAFQYLDSTPQNVNIEVITKNQNYGTSQQTRNI